MIDNISNIEKLFIYPTDTVWGLGSSIYSEKGYENIAKIKQTSKSKPLTVLFSCFNHVKEFINLPKEFDEVTIRRLFSMELTLVVPENLVKKEIPSWITQGQKTVAFRCLEGKEIKQIIDLVGSPITTTSLNISGDPPIKSKEEAFVFFENLKKLFPEELEFINVDSHELSGRPSTIVYVETVKRPFEIKFFRKGSLAEKIEQYIRSKI